MIISSQISQKFTTSFAILAMPSVLRASSRISPSQTFQLEALKNTLDSNSLTQVKMGNFSNYKYSRVAGHILAAKPLQELYCELNVHEGQSEYSEFAKYLCKVPVSVVRDVAEACYLSNLAYKISEIKEEFELQHFRHLTLVTTSLHMINYRENAASDTGAENLSPRRKIVMDFSGGHVGVKNSMSADEHPRFENDKFSSCTKTSGNAVSSHLHTAAELRDKEEATLQSSSSSYYNSNVPCDWFVCDKQDAAIRIFAIQGSQSMASWKANLLFQPIQFEDERSGVMVHAGVYEVARALYDRMLPLVQAHQREESGYIARIIFTGHSLGGSLAELLALMFAYRGVIVGVSLCPIYTFGAPCILSGGVQPLLKRLGLPPTHIQSVVMSYDLVPRIFSCDIPKQIIEVLKRINENFRNMSSFLQRRQLYSLSGHLLILQADVLAPSHPLLPLGSGLYNFSHKLEDELRAAQRCFLNTPHPLEIMSKPSAYGSNGGICRFHDPRSYLLALEHSLQQASL